MLSHIASSRKYAKICAVIVGIGSETEEDENTGMVAGERGQNKWRRVRAYLHGRLQAPIVKATTARLL